MNRPAVLLFRRVVLLLDESQPPNAGLRVARRIALDEARLQAIRLADRDLPRLRSLPVFRETPAPVRRVAAPAASAVQPLSAAADTAPAAGGEISLTVIPCPAGATWIGSRWQHEIPAGTVLYVNEPWETGSSILAVVGSGDPALDQRVLQIGRWLSWRERCPLHTTGSSAAPPEDVPAGRYRQAPVESADPLLSLCEELDARVLICPRTLAPDWRGPRARLMTLLDSSLLLVG